MQKPTIDLDLDFATAQVVILIADALDTGGLNPDAPVITARATAAAIYGANPTRANVLFVGDVLTRLGCWCKGHGPYPHARRDGRSGGRGAGARGTGEGRQANPTRAEGVTALYSPIQRHSPWGRVWGCGWEWESGQGQSPNRREHGQGKDIHLD